MTLSNCLPIIKPFDNACNLKCLYCYMNGIMRSQHKAQLMDDSTLYCLIDFFCSKQKHVEFIWHGGEPLLAGLDFFKRAMFYQKAWTKSGKKIENSIQTNATLITKEWASFFRENGFSVGVSLDGPQKMHDVMRRSRSGKCGSFDSAMNGIAILKDAGVFKGISCCVSTVNHSFPEEVLDFFISQDIKSIKFLRVKGQDQQGNFYKGSITSDQYVDFLLAIFRKWLEIDDPELEILDIKSVVDILLGGSFRECVYMGECYNYVTVYSDGSIYACDALAQYDFLNFGNVKNFNYSSLNFSKFVDFVKLQRNSCKKCNWFKVCRGGCLQDRTLKAITNQVVSNASCDSLKRFYSKIASTLKQYNLLSSELYS
ncbi:MAG: SPASM domain-containing protein [Candidatus Portnoybacteria bacterium]|nr:SPASM domain-containing protein [Candidatus Portnoybacteria bacterium]